MTLHELITDDAYRHREFPVTGEKIFMAHAAVATLPRVARDTLVEYARMASTDNQENPWVWEQVLEARRLAAQLLGARSSEIALLGPTALGLNLVADGLAWQSGDEVVYYADDYPANVYPWLKLRDRGVTPVALRLTHPGVITWEVVEASLTARTRLVSLATCHFLTGYRVDVEGIGRRLRERGILFCLDAIQTLGAFPLSVEHVDFLSADAHKWMLGPIGQGIVYVRQERQETLQPTLLGSWNVESPEFIAQDTIAFYPGARRYEPGSLNMPGILGMAASLRMLLEVGVGTIAHRILALRRELEERLLPLGFTRVLEAQRLSDAERAGLDSGILSVRHHRQDLEELHRSLKAAGVDVSLRQNREGERFLRFSPHFYNTEAEIDRVVELVEENTARPYTLARPARGLPRRLGIRPAVFAGAQQGATPGFPGFHG